jgi:hypothetical protein
MLTKGLQAAQHRSSFFAELLSGGGVVLFGKAAGAWHVPKRKKTHESQSLFAGLPPALLPEKDFKMNCPLSSSLPIDALHKRIGCLITSAASTPCALSTAAMTTAGVSSCCCDNRSSTL